MKPFKTISIDLQTHKIIKDLAEDLGITEKQLIRLMATFTKSNFQEFLNYINLSNINLIKIVDLDNEVKIQIILPPYYKLLYTNRYGVLATVEKIQRLLRKYKIKYKTVKSGKKYRMYIITPLNDAQKLKLIKQIQLLI